jgi:hypothetical protein
MNRPLLFLVSASLAALGARADVTAAAGNGQSAAAMSDWNIVDHIPLNGVIIQAHRGPGLLAEENTLAALGRIASDTAASSKS